MKKVGLILSLVILGIIGVGIVRQKKILAQAPSKMVLTQYHIFWTKQDKPLDWRRNLPNSEWQGWNKKWMLSGTQNSPENLILPWKRETVSRLGLPITGFYSTNLDLEKMRYDFTQAKKAGIDGMFVSVFDGDWYPIFENHLKVAREVGMKLGIDWYMGGDQPDADVGKIPMVANGCKLSWTRMVADVTNRLRTYKDNPAFLNIEGKPAIYIANYAGLRLKTKFPISDCPDRPYHPWGNKEEFENSMKAVEQNLGVRPYVVMTSTAKDIDNISFGDSPYVDKVNSFDALGLFWNVIGGKGIQITPLATSAQKISFENSYNGGEQFAKQVLGDKYITKAYAAFDERGLFPTTMDRGSGQNVPRTVITRSGNGMFADKEGFLEFVVNKAKANNTWLLIESWNDWQEQHQLEPGFAFNNYSKHGDMFSALRTVAKYKDLNPTFDYPDRSILDKPLYDSCRYWEFENKKVRLKGRYGLVQSTNSSGLSTTFGIQYLDDDISVSSPSYESVGQWKGLSSTTKSYNGSLIDLDVDITKYLDKKGIVFGIDVAGNRSDAKIAFTSLVLDWYGKEIDLLNPSLLSQFAPHTQSGGLTFGTAPASNGGALLSPQVTLEDNQSYSNKLLLAPNTSNNGFVHLNLNFMALKDSIYNACKEISPDKAGDANRDNLVNLSDFVQWKKEFAGRVTTRLADLNHDNKVDLADFVVWKKSL